MTLLDAYHEAREAAEEAYLLDEIGVELQQLRLALDYGNAIISQLRREGVIA